MNHCFNKISQIARIYPFRAMHARAAAALLACMSLQLFFSQALAFDESSAVSSMLSESIAEAQKAVEAAASKSSVEISVAASNSLSSEYLEGLGAALRRTGGRLVVRGIDVGLSPNRNDVRTTISEAARKAKEFEEASFFALDATEQQRVRERIGKGLRAMAAKSKVVGFEIDPQFFRTHRIDAVPVFVVRLTSSARADNRALEVGANPRTYIVRGALDLHWVLEAMADRAKDRGLKDDVKRLSALADAAMGVGP